MYKKGCGDNAQMLDKDKGWAFGLGYCLVGVILGVGYEPLTVSYFGQRLVFFCSAKKGTKKGGKNPIAPPVFFSSCTDGR